jgi:hypothetical protein
VAVKLAVRPSSRPKNSSTTRRTTWVESTRSVAEWKVPMFRARECRSAAAEALGANGSCTCTKSNGTLSRICSIVRETSTGTDTDPLRRAGGKGMLCPTPSTRQPGSSNTASGSDASRFATVRDSRISERESDGASTTTRCPRAHSSSESRST